MRKGKDEKGGKKSKAKAAPKAKKGPVRRRTKSRSEQTEIARSLARCHPDLRGLERVLLGLDRRKGEDQPLSLAAREKLRASVLGLS